jgi:hypothetical protein
VRKVDFIICIHNHQPVGNFEWVVEEAYEKSYLPLLRTLEEFPNIRVCLHNSGCLLEVLGRTHPEYLDMLKAFVRRGQAEILTGGFYEPILSMIPEQDRVGQICALTEYLDRHLGARARGMWVAERVWEPDYPSSIVRAGVDYTVLDDYHFLSAGLGIGDLEGYYLTEDSGLVLRVFPGSKKLRYLIPFRHPSETLSFFKSLAATDGSRLAVFADDGEKFGVWPGTYEHVHKNGWLRAFLTMLSENRSWLRTRTFSEYMDLCPAKGRVYLPTAAYAEMMEWALPYDSRQSYSRVLERYGEDGEVVRFIRGGFWRNFLAKYPESNFMRARMLHARRRIELLDHDDKAYREALDEVWKAQCNCAYWHGVFGGLYLPHLRNAVYEHIIKAEAKARGAVGSTGLSVHLDDIDMDLADEVLIEDDSLFACIDPVAGGSVVELDLREIGFNLINTLARHRETYHRKILNSSEHKGKGVASIHDIARRADKEIEGVLFYDRARKACFVDHLLPEHTTLEALYKSREKEVLPLYSKPYEARISGQGRESVVTLLGRAPWEGYDDVMLGKRFSFPSEGVIECTYSIKGVLEALGNCILAVEFNFSLLDAGSGKKRYFCREYDITDPSLDSRGVIEGASDFGIVDQDLGIRIGLQVSRPCSFWRFPIETVSVSEGGFERICQSSCLISSWPMTQALSDWGVDFRLEVGAI